MRTLPTGKNIEEQLRQAQKMEAIGQLAGGIAHDFNNQLASILGFAELIHAKSSQDNIVKYAKKIISIAENSSRLTKQLLTYSRKNDLQLQLVDIHHEINQLVELIQHSIDKRIKINLQLNSPKSAINVDKSLIQNALLNIVINARDAMPDGGSITILTSTTLFPEQLMEKSDCNILELPCIKIAIQDTGCGISKENYDKIFEPFYSTKDVNSGTGLGLATTYSAVQQMGRSD